MKLHSTVLAIILQHIFFFILFNAINIGWKEKETGRIARSDCARLIIKLESHNQIQLYLRDDSPQMSDCRTAVVLLLLVLLLFVFCLVKVKL